MKRRNESRREGRFCAPKDDGELGFEFFLAVNGNMVLNSCSM